MREKRNKEDVFDLIQKHPEGLDDDHISGHSSWSIYLRISSNNCLLRCSTTDSRISWAGCFEVPAGTETDNDCTVAQAICVFVATLIAFVVFSLMVHTI
ncbi:MAG: hypothetical protein DMG17_25730 [Acidobacteria bacterium]|nr:MAG: hypothetical protein DMG17_25730 [Acidobacteriota bacterium]